MNLRERAARIEVSEGMAALQTLTTTYRKSARDGGDPLATRREVRRVVPGHRVTANRDTATAGRTARCSFTSRTPRSVVGVCRMG
ncbi:hypothetical protein GCM10010869_65030 [Mesorhizobium tianshanense]|nr:hypothetical protein GCM10010869_65030 [Mesorhizobium tianshanense]